MPRLWQALHLAQEVGARLEECKVLLRALLHRAAPDGIAAEIGAVMTALRIILGDQLSVDLSALADLDPGRDIVLMMEVQEEYTYVRHHKQKIVLVLSAMRHFAAELAARGVRVDYVPLDDPANSGSFDGEIERLVRDGVITLATAMLYGIKSDTFLLTRDTNEWDVEAFSYLYPMSNHNLMRRIERPELPPAALDALSLALKNRRIIEKVAFVHLVQHLHAWRFHFVDCQTYSAHLARFGASLWRRERFLQALAGALQEPTRQGRWHYIS